MGSIDALQWMLIGRCNYNCSHCYLGKENRTEPELYQLLSYIPLIKEAGIKKVILTGGEPLMRRGFDEIIREITEAGIVITAIITNGSLVTKELIAMLRSYGQTPAFCISYDGDVTHDVVRNCEGAREKTLRAFELCKEEGLKTTSDMTLYRGNADDLRSTMKTLQEHGCSSVKISPLIKAGNAKNNDNMQMLTPVEVLNAFCDYIPYYYMDKIETEVFMSAYFYASGYNGIWDIPAERFRMYVDGCGRTLCAKEKTVPFLYMDGRLLPCAGVAGFPEARSMMKKITEGGLKKAMKAKEYRDFLGYTLSEYAKNNPECKECEFLTTCMGGCRIISALEGYGIHGRDRYFCTYFRNGYEDKIKKAVQIGKTLETAR